jgi:hypothetical protein
MHDMPLPEIWHIDPVTAMVSSGESLIDPVVIVVEPRPSLSVVIAEICDFLRIRVERLPHGAGICQSLRDMQPIAVLSEAEEIDYRVYDLLMSVAEYDPHLSILMVLNDDPASRGALDGARDLWQLTDVVRSPHRPGIRELIDFLFRAGSKSGARR